MRPDVASFLAATAAAVLVGLLLPKRDWRSIVPRLRAVASSRRHHVFGPPANGEPLSRDLVERWLQVVRRELARAVALGLPLHVLAMVVEGRGARRREELLRAWSDSSAGLLLRHLTGDLGEDDMEALRREHGQPPAASKAVWDSPVKLSMPPMSMREEWERELDALRAEAPIAGEQPAQSDVTASTEADSRFELEIKTLGEFRICHHGRDLAPLLIHQPVAAFMWQYLLAREVRRPGDRITRAAFADLMFPRLTPDRQRKGLRGRLDQLRRAQPAVVLQQIRSEGEYLRLDITGCDLDVRRVLNLAERVRSVRDDELSQALMDEVEMMLSRSAGEFLPDWEETERRAGADDSGATEVVSDVRNMVVAAYLMLASALADGYLTRRQPDRAITHLVEALRRRPERPELARKLARVYEQAGLWRRAAEIRGEYGIDEVGRSPPFPTRAA